MTAGALVQLETGNISRMAFLTLNPQISHFKSVYRKYTNFSSLYISELPIFSKELALNQETKTTFNISRNGDLIKDIFLTIELPDIYSSSQQSFQWIKRIGEYLIKEVSIRFDVQEIDRHSSEWLHANCELYYDEEHKKAYYEMIGNIPEIYDPANAPGNNGIYPSNPAIPSIMYRKLYIPLCFWFNNYSSMAFPLIALQKSIVSIDFTFRRLYELYTVLDTTTNYRVQPQASDQTIGNFLNPKSLSQTSLNINPKLEINNIFLDDEERKRFAAQSHEYLITQLQTIQGYYTDRIPTINLIDMNKPVKQIIFMIRRSDMETANQWSNYTNWNLDNIPPYSVGYYNPNGAPLTINAGNLQYYRNKNLLKVANLKLNGNDFNVGSTVSNDNPKGESINGQDFIFYNKVQSYSSNRNLGEEGIYTYTFALDNKTLQPTGAINMSNINKKELNLTLTSISPTGYLGTTYNYNIIVFAVRYDILNIIGGIAGIRTAN